MLSSKTVTNPNYNNFTTSVVHQGNLYVFKYTDDPADPKLYYATRDTTIAQEDEDLRWGGFVPLDNPDSLRPAGMEIITVPFIAGIAGFAQQPFQVVSDNQYIYVFRQSTCNTIFVNRYSVTIAESNTSGGIQRSLQPAWEVRFQGSSKKDIPLSDKDNQTYRDVSNNPFIEPVTDLSMIRNVKYGCFTVLLLPAAQQQPARWTIFSLNETTQFIEVFSFPQRSDGLFDLSSSEFDTVTNLIKPDLRFNLTDGTFLNKKNNNPSITLSSGMSAALYYRQEPSFSASGSQLLFKRNARVMLAFASSKEMMATIDFSVASNGQLARIDDGASLSLSNIDPAPEVLCCVPGGLATLKTPLSLPQAFTFEAWINPSAPYSAGTDQLILCGTNITDPAAAPFLKLNTGVLCAGYGDGLTIQTAQTTSPLIPSNAWTHVAVTFNAPSDSASTVIQFYINGVMVLSVTKSGKSTGTNPLTCIGNTSAGNTGFTGMLSEIRIWNSAISVVQIQNNMYHQLPAQTSGMIGYWQCDTLTTSMPPCTPDISTKGNDALLEGLKLTASNSPVSSKNFGTTVTDANGLTIQSGFLNFDGFTSGTPCLLAAADGNIRLYQNNSGSGAELSVAEYYTTSARPAFGLPWQTAGNDDKGNVILAARRPGMLYNKTKITIATNNLDTSLVDLTLDPKFPGADIETYHGIPADISLFTDVINGNAAFDPNDPDIVNNTNFFYDYSGTYPVGTIHLSDQEIKVISCNYNNILLGSITITASETSETSPTINVSLGFKSAGLTSVLTQLWQGVPSDAQSFGICLNGTLVSSNFSYTIPEGPSVTGVYSISVDNGPSLVMLALTQGIFIKQLNVTPSACMGNGYCDVAIKVASATNTYEFSKQGVPRKSSDFWAVIANCSAADGTLFKSLFFLGSDPDNTVSLQNLQPAGVVDLRATCSLFTVQGANSTELVPAGNYPAVIVQHAVSAKGADLSSGSGMFTALPVTLPLSGETAILQSLPAVLLQAGYAGGWTASSANFALLLDAAGTSATVNTSNASATPLTAAGDMTLEVWINKPTDSLYANPGLTERIINYHNLKNADSLDVSAYTLGIGHDYTLGVGTTNANSFLMTNDEFPAVQDTKNYTFQAWIRISEYDSENLPGDIFVFGYGSFQSLYPTNESFEGLIARPLPNNRIELLYYFTDQGPLTTGTTIGKNEWVHLCCVRYSTGAAVYVNGKNPSAIPNSSVLSVVTNVFCIGNPRLVAFTQDNFVLSCNHARFFNAYSSDTEVLNRFNNEVNNIPIIDDNLILWWKITEGGTSMGVYNYAPYPAWAGSVLCSAAAPPSWTPNGVFSYLIGTDNAASYSSGSFRLNDETYYHAAMTRKATSGLLFDGTTYATCGAKTSAVSSALSDMADTFFADCWINPTTTSIQQAIISKGGQDPSNGTFEIGLNSDNTCYAVFYFLSNGNVNSYNITSPKTVCNGSQTAFHIAAGYHIDTTYTSTGDNQSSVKNVTITLALYVNGQNVASSTPVVNSQNSYAINPSTADLEFGKGMLMSTEDGTDKYYQGYLAHLRFWNKVLTDADVASLYNNDQTTGNGSPAHHWSFTEMKGRTASDIIGNVDALLTKTSLWSAFQAGNSISLFLNGNRMTVTKNNSPIMLPDTAELRFSGIKNNRALTEEFCGCIDEIRIWNTLLTQEQLQDSMYRKLSGNEQSLAGYWTFNEGSGTMSADQTVYANDCTITVPPSVTTSWTRDASPTGNDSPVAGNVLISSTRQNNKRQMHAGDSNTVLYNPSIIDFPDTEIDAYGNVFAVMKRCYVYSSNEVLTIDSGFKISDLNSVHLGQVQLNPTIVGYAEGAPPLPSENLTQPYWNQAGSSDYFKYQNASSISLIQSEESNYSFTSGDDTGLDFDINGKVGFLLSDETSVGLGVVTVAEKFEGKAQATTENSISYGTTAGEGFTGKLGSEILNEIGSRGEWENKDLITNPAVGRRFVPANDGYAIVKSATGDLYASVMRSTGAMMSLTVIPNPDIPADVNIISFPIDNAYTVNGILDGQIGFTNAGSTQSSYFLPLEAYAFKRKIEKEKESYEAYWDQFSTRQVNGVQTNIDTDPLYNWQAKIPLKSIANTYVWSAQTGLYKEEENFSSTSTESSGGYFNYKDSAGFHDELSNVINDFGVAGESDFLAGQHNNVIVAKSKDGSESYGLDISLDCESFLKNFDIESQTYDATNTPGKVAAYRFMSFFMAPNDTSFDELFTKVIDQNWLLHSNDPNAAALLEAKSNRNAVWRILHRVTYVNRVPPPFQNSPLLSPVIAQKPPANLASNYAMTDLINTVLHNASQPTLPQIGAAIKTIAGTAGHPGTLDTIVPWWGNFVNLLQQPDKLAIFNSLCLDLLNYYHSGYQTGLFSQPYHLLPSCFKD